jgi:hypothetical protein
MAAVFRNQVRSRDRGPYAVIPVCAALLILAGSGCGVRGDGEAPPCFPPPYSVDPTSAKPGENVTVAAPDAGCDPRYGDDARILVIVTDANGVKVLEATSPMNDAGGFSYGFDVPAQTAPGAATVTAMPYNIDWCDDTGKNNRAAAAGTSLILEPASCAIPIRLLTIK